MSKIDYTLICMKNRRIGVLPPGSYINSHPHFYETEPLAMIAVLEANVGKKMRIVFDDSCFNGKGSHATFNPNDFRRECHERSKTFTPQTNKQNRNRSAVL